MPTRPDLETLVRDHRADLWWYLRGLGCDAATAEDIAQEAFLALLAPGFEYRSRRETFAWLRTTARNRLVSLHRRARRELPVDADEMDALWTRFAPDERLAEIREALADCMGQLTARAREAVELRFQAGHKTREIAARTRTRPAAVTKLLQRAKQSLKACLEKHLGTHGEGRHGEAQA